MIKCDLSEIYEHVQNVTTDCNTLRFLESWQTEYQNVSTTHYCYYVSAVGG